jgi:hypothetical protein
MTVIRNHPQVYAKGCALGLFTYALPSSNYYYLDENRKMIPTYERIYNLVVFGQPLAFDMAGVDEQAEGYVGRKLLVRGWFLVIGLPILFWYGFRRARRASAAGEAAFATTLYFLLGTIAYVTIVGNAIEIGENNRFRYTIEPYIAVLAALALTRLWQRAATWWFPEA